MWTSNLPATETPLLSDRRHVHRPPNSGKAEEFRIAYFLHGVHAMGVVLTDRGARDQPGVASQHKRATSGQVFGRYEDSPQPGRLSLSLAAELRL